ncbi:MAG: FtsL-like putative cell division protein [Schleiferiaceae bacterium]|nr:FtsL-like putative cell division protein [Schleiferiaceae bacterium]
MKLLNQRSIGALKEILRGSFFGHPIILKNLPFVLYITTLALIQIWAAHRAESNVRIISKMTVEINELESQYLDSKSKLMKMGQESSVQLRAEELGLIEMSQAPISIKKPNDE